MTEQISLFETEQETETNEISFDDLSVLWLTDDGLPTFIADREDICDIVESFGFNIYYLIANEKKEVKPTTPTSGSTVTYNNSNKTATVNASPVIVRSAKIFRVVNNFIGRSVAEYNPPLSHVHCDIEEEAIYNMPPIPHILIDKLDQFFRLVDAQHGTESIVMLTYDVEKEGSEGWGILVPDQTNTSVHCNYDPNSIAEIKADNIMIVGSVHSHPGMAAYASGTDHADQADFDGIHITFGWQKSVNNGATQYYIEMQMAGKAYKLDPEDVFEDYIIDKAPDPEVVGWTDKVKKVSPPNTGGTHTTVLGTPPNQTTQEKTQVTPKQRSTTGGATTKPSSLIAYADHIADIIEEVDGIGSDMLLVCEVYASFSDAKSAMCPSCFSSVPLISLNLSNACSTCDIPLVEANESADEMVYNMLSYCNQRNISTNVPLYLLSKDYANNFMAMRLTPTTIDDYVNIAIDGTTPATSDRYEEAYKSELTLCCSQKKEDCFCITTVLPIDGFDFDQFMGSADSYTEDSVCLSCVNYYSLDCPMYSAAIVDFVTSDIKPTVEKYAKSIDGQNCNQFMVFESSTYNPLTRDGYDYYD